MTVSYRDILWKHWVLYFISTYCFHSLSRVIEFDPFLVERIFSLVLVIFVLFVSFFVMLKSNFQVSKKTVSVAVFILVMLIYSASIEKFGYAPIFFLLYFGVIAFLLSP